MDSQCAATPFGAGENPRIAIVGTGGMGRSHAEDGHVKNEQVVTLRDIDDHNLEPAALVHVRNTPRHGADGHGPAGQPRSTHRYADRMGRRASARRTRWRSWR